MNVTTDQLLTDFHALARALSDTQLQRDLAVGELQAAQRRVKELEARESEKTPTPEVG